MSGLLQLRSAWLTACLVAIAACGPSPEVDHPEPPPLPQGDPAPPGCNDPESCALEGAARLEAGEEGGFEMVQWACDHDHGDACHLAGIARAEAGNHQEAQALYERGCGLASGVSCEEAAAAWLRGKIPKDEAKAREHFDKACELDNPRGCYNAGVFRYEGTAGEADQLQARVLFNKSCDLQYHFACRNLGIMYYRGEGGPKDLDAAQATFDKACRYGNDEGCAFSQQLAEERGSGGPAPQPAPGPATTSDDIEGANLTMGSVSADGFTAKDLSCNASGLGLLGGAVLVGGLAKQKAQLQACAKGSEPRVRWSLQAGKVTKTTVSGVDEKAARCIATVMQQATLAGDGECIATFVL